MRGVDMRAWDAIVKVCGVLIDRDGFREVVEEKKRRVDGVENREQKTWSGGAIWGA